MLIMIIVTIIFGLFKIIFSFEKVQLLITRFNTLADDKKAKYDEIALCKLVGKVMFALVFNMLLLERYELNLLFVFSIISLVGILIFS